MDAEMTERKLKPETEKILQLMFDKPKEIIDFKEIAKLTRMQQQEAMYYVDELNKNEFIYGYSSMTEKQNFRLSPKGRAYVMDNLRS